jgi:hypothetical protein
MLTVSTREHQMTVLRDEGLYRHIRFQQPGTEIWRFDLVTWPGHLVITGGDVQDFHFARIPDMFEFFRGPVGHVNPGYWAEKLCGNAQRYQSYSPEKLKARVFQHFRLACSLRPGPHRPLWQAICRDVLDPYVSGDEATARQALSEFQFYSTPTDFNPEPARDFTPQRVPRPGYWFEFADSWDWDLHDFDYHFLVSLHAIVWGIHEYDTAKAAAA